MYYFFSNYVRADVLLTWKMNEKSSWNPDVFLNSICLWNTGDQGKRELWSSAVHKVEQWTWLQTLSKESTQQQQALA